MDKEMVTKITGPLLFSYLTNWAFQGILCVQIYKYYTAFPNDRLSSKVLVYGLFVIEIAQSIIMAKDAFDTFVLDFANQEALAKVRSFWFSLPILGAVVGSIYRIFLIHRLHTLSSLWVTTLLGVSLTITAAIAAFLTGARFHRVGTLTWEYPVPLFIGLWSGSGAICDIFISVCMVHSLLRQNANFKSTRKQITSLIVVTIETGVMTATISSLGFLLFICIEGEVYFMVPATMSVKLYSNAMLLTLNNRINIVGGRNEHHTHYGDKLSGVQDQLQ